MHWLFQRASAVYGPLTRSISTGKWWKDGRGARIRTGGPLVPNQVRYQTALRPDGTPHNTLMGKWARFNLVSLN